jgi:hypothetical protein
MRSICAIKRNGFKCKYFETFIHRHVGSIGAPNRRTVFVSGTSAEQRESPEIAGRNTKVNIFYKGGVRFEATVDLNKKEGRQSNISSCVKSEDLIFPRQQ